MVARANKSKQKQGELSSNFPSEVRLRGQEEMSSLITPDLVSDIRILQTAATKAGRNALLRHIVKHELDKGNIGDALRLELGKLLETIQEADALFLNADRAINNRIRKHLQGSENSNLMVIRNFGNEVAKFGLQIVRLDAQLAGVMKDLASSYADALSERFVKKMGILAESLRPSDSTENNLRDLKKEISSFFENVDKYHKYLEKFGVSSDKREFLNLEIMAKSLPDEINENEDNAPLVIEAYERLEELHNLLEKLAKKQSRIVKSVESMIEMTIRDFRSFLLS